MKIDLMCTPSGLIPVDDYSYDEKKKLRNGELYSAEIKLHRNYRLHKLFFALINTGYAYLPGEIQDKYFKSVEGFRKSVLIAAGYTKVYYNLRLQTFVEEAASISFTSMDDADFRDCYDRCKDVIFALIGKYITQEEFERNLSTF